MAEARRNRIDWLVVGALCLSTPAAIFAQSRHPDSIPPNFVQIQSPQSGSLAGRLTNLRSAPLAGVAIVLRNQSTGAEVHTTSAKNGAFCFASLDAGEYTLDAYAAQLGHGHLEGILVAGGVESRVQTALSFEPPVPALIEATAPAQFAGPPVAAVPAPLIASVPPAILTPVPTPIPPMPAPVTAASPSATPEPSALQGAQTQSRVPVFSQRAALETQSVAVELAIAVALPRAFPLNPGAALTLTTTAVPDSLLQPAKLDPRSVASATAAAQPSDPVAQAVSTTISASQLQALPASGRRWQEFLLDTPAAGASTDSSEVFYRGSQQSAQVTVDGANIGLVFGVSASSGPRASDSTSADSDPESRIGQSGSQASTGWRGLGVSEAAVREVTTASGNVEAEGMRSAGGRTTISTESGGNALHGQGFLFDRQNTWGAQNPFTQWVQNTGSTTAPNFTAIPFTPPDHETVWGIGVGSDVRRNRLFWFAALDSNHRNDPGLSTVKNPTEFFTPPEPTSPSVTLLSAQLGESQNQAYNDYLGLATSAYAPAGLEQLASLLGPAPRTSAQWVGFGRVDWQAAERHHFTLEWIGADLSAPGGGLTRVSETYGNHSFGSSQASQQWLLARWEAYLTANLLAVTQGSAGRAILSARPDTPSSFERSFLSGNSWGQLPQIVVDSRYGFTIGNPTRFGQGSYPDERPFQGQEMLDWIHNKLLVKVGFELDHDADAVSQLRNQTGTYSYSTVANFISDALAFQKFGFADALDPANPHNCGATDADFGSQPCYSHYSQTMGPTNWHLSTDSWAGYATAQWQLNKLVVLSAGLRWEREQMPPPIAALANPEIPQTESMPDLGNNWGPRLSFAIGKAHDRWPVLRLGYGMYYGRVENATVETALTQTGSLKGDLSFFMRPSDDCQHCSGGAPPFPYVFAGQPSSVVKPGAVEFAPNFRNPEVHQAVAAIEQPLPGHVQLAASASLSLGRRMPIYIDTNFDPAVNPGTITYAVKDPTGEGPIKTAQITVPLYASWPTSTGVVGWLNPDYQGIEQITSKANSIYEAAMVKLTRFGRRGLSLQAHYTYAHAMDWNPNQSPLDPNPAKFSQEYGTSDQDMRHSAAAMIIYEAPWKLRGFAGRLANGWVLSGIGQFRSGLPYSMRVTGSIPECVVSSGVTPCTTAYTGLYASSSSAAIAGLRPGMNGSGGDNRLYGLARNTFRYPDTWKADLRLAKRFDLGEMRQLELLAETFNLFNHQNVTELETTGYAIENSSSSGTFPTLCFLTINMVLDTSGCGTATTTGSGIFIPAFGKPLNVNGSDFYRERQIQFGLRLRF